MLGHTDCSIDPEDPEPAQNKQSPGTQSKQFKTECAIDTIETAPAVCSTSPKELSSTPKKRKFSIFQKKGDQSQSLNKVKTKSLQLGLNELDAICDNFEEAGLNAGKGKDSALFWDYSAAFGFIHDGDWRLFVFINNFPYFVFFSTVSND